MMVIFLLRPAMLKGAEWSFTPLASLEGLYNDNYQLVSLPHHTEWAAMFLPEVLFSMENEKWNISGKGHWSFNRFFQDPELNADEHDLSLSTSLNMSEKRMIHFSESNQVDTTLESELNQTGLFVVWTERYLNTISLGYEEKINERLNLNHQYIFTDVSYAGNNFGLNDYFVHSFSSSLQEDWNERMKLFSNGYFSYSQIEGFLTIARDIGFSGGSKFQYSEAIKGSLSAGGHWTDTSISFIGETLQNRGSGWTLAGQIEKEFESGHAVLDLTQDIQVSGAGTIIQVDRASAGFDQNISERLSLSLNAALSLSQPFANPLFFPRSEYRRYEGKIIWKATNEIDLTLEYSYIRVATERVPASPEANSAYLLATWHPLKKSISR